VVLPADNHVHSEWSWDALNGSMEQTCARAAEIGLSALAFTEHVDHTKWTATADDFDEDLRPLIGPDGLVTPPVMDVDGYLECVQRCREKFPSLRIISGMELGEPHRHKAAISKLLHAGSFDQLLGSLHCLPDGDRFLEPPDLFRKRPAAEVVRDYLTELPRLIAGSDVFAVLAHIDYPFRYWPADAGPFDPNAFEDEFREALRALARSGRALEVNTTLPLDPRVVRWWHEEGGEAITFGSDAHDPTGLARGFRDAAAMVEANGFRPGRHPFDFWARSG
jgi:histidinol-phosphatase (PHP family)